MSRYLIKNKADDKSFDSLISTDPCYSFYRSISHENEKIKRDDAIAKWNSNMFLAIKYGHNKSNSVLNDIFSAPTMNLYAVLNRMKLSTVHNRVL